MQEPDRRVVETLVLVFAIIALELAWLLFIGPASGYPGYTAECERDCQVPWWTTAEFWIAAFTAALTLSTFLLWWATRKSVQLAERTLNDLERPWVFVTDIHPTSIFRSPPVLEVEIINYGKTVGRVLSVMGGVKAAAKEIDISIAEITLRERMLSEVRDTIPPDKPYTAPLSLAPYASANAPTMIQSGDANYVVRAVLRYRGLTDQIYETAFCIRYDAEGKRFRPHGGEEYNYTT